MSTSRRRRTPAGSTVRRRSTKAREFWGPDALADAHDTVIAPSGHPTALVESLGPPPFPGGRIAELHFAVVYERAAGLALALAASAGLIATTEPLDEDGSTEPPTAA
jgi:hypothetical protein